MKRSLFIGFFLSFHIGLVIIHLHKESYYTKCSYKKQSQEILISSLMEKKSEGEQFLCSLANHDQIKKYAQKNLAMHPITLTQIKKIPDKNESTI